MNLLLYAEARQTFARQRGEAAQDSNPLPELPDSLFEELGYYGALDTDETDETDPGEDLGELFRWFNESALNLQT